MEERTAAGIAAANLDPEHHRGRLQSGAYEQTMEHFDRIGDKEDTTHWVGEDMRDTIEVIYYNMQEDEEVRR